MKMKSKSYDVIAPIEEFNRLAGFDKKPRHLEHPDVQAQMTFISEEYEELMDAMGHLNLTEVLDASGDIIVTVVGLLHKLGFDAKDVVKVVNDSNLSKFCDTGVNAALSVESYNQDKRYENAHSEVVNRKHVIYGNKVGETGKKILKGVNFQEPDFRKVIDDCGQRDLWEGLNDRA